jgi:PKD repeat protein
MSNRMGLYTVVAVLFLTASAGAALTPSSLTMRAQCREACVEEIAACAELEGRVRYCRRHTLRMCRQEGVSICLSDPPVPLAAGIKVPTQLTATALSSSSIRLTWTDTSTREAGYEIERSLSGSGGWSLIAVTAVNATSYQNNGLAASTRYYYRMRSVGPKGAHSLYSTIVSAATFAGAVTTTSTTSTSTSTAPVAPPVTTTTIAGNQPPVAQAGPDQFTQTLTSLGFNGSGSTDPNGNISSYTWNFGDGGTGSGASVSHSYASAGTYTVTLTVRDSGGLSDTDTAVVSVSNRPPTANAGPDKSGTPGSAITLTGSGSDPDGTVASYTWNAGDGATGSGTTITHAYANPGTYTATFTVRDNMGAQTSDTAAVVVNSTSGGGALRWSDSAGDAWDDRGRDVALDAAGNVVATGDFRGTIDLGGGPMTAFKLSYQAAMPSDIFIVKYSPSGAHLWSKRIGAHGDDAGTAVAVDASGDVVVAGFAGPNVDFGGGELPTGGSWDFFVAKYAGTDGHYLWAKRFGGAEAEFPWAMALDAAGNVLVTGEFTGSPSFGGGQLTSAGDRDVFVAKYAGSNGQHLWSQRFGSALTDVGNGIAVDANGDLVVIGSFGGTVNFGGAPLTSAGDRDAFVAKYSGTNGQHLWSKRFGSTSVDEGSGVAVDAAGNVTVTGAFIGTVDFGGGALVTPNAAGDVFLAQYTSAGSHRWSKRLGGTNGDSGRSLATDSNGNVTLIGAFQGGVDFGGGALTSAGSFDVFVAQYSGASGQHLWSRRFGGTDNDRCQGLASSTGSVVVTGYFPGTVNFGDGSRTSVGSNDIFLFNLLP